jgi:hypothetical protein
VERCPLLAHVPQLGDRDAEAGLGWLAARFLTRHLSSTETTLLSRRWWQAAATEGDESTGQHLRQNSLRRPLVEETWRNEHPVIIRTIR